VNRATQRQHGQFDWRDLYKPADPEAIAREIRRLRLTGLKPHDIATALRVGLGVVRQALGPMEGDL
jgi:hypothetical protein